jgi:hypothetical protein
MTDRSHIFMRDGITRTRRIAAAFLATGRERLDRIPAALAG